MSMASDQTSWVTESAYDQEYAEDAQVLPLIGDAGDRRVVVEWLASQYDVVTADEAPEALRERTVDLCILDPTSFEQYHDVLIDYKEEQAPRILPYLLIRREDTPLLDPDAKQYIDDVIVTPISQRELALRIKSLLQLRALSFELEQKNDQLERRNEQLEYLVNAAAHDLRNPLQIAKGYAQQLDDGDPVTRIRNALTRMEHLVENLLTVHRTEQGITDENFESIEFTTLIADCWEMIDTTNTDTELEVDGTEGVQIRAVPELVRQLVENLLCNAIEHGGDSVTIRIGMLSEAEGVYIADDGPGVPTAERETVFEEGYSTGDGNGLGLAIVKRVVDTHDWEVRVIESDLGGARFEIMDVEINMAGPNQSQS